jgi:hypothetical protein
MWTILPISAPVMERIEFVLCGLSFFSGSAVGSFTNVTVTSCKESDPVCVLKRSSNVTLDIYFTTRKDSNYGHSLLYFSQQSL